ncbi:hypothetical protein DS745_22460 [Anaerobacillus alkaliphilus]|uniref:Uncharacterized protein n=1 Tax=Anaerobacillus alkaliphilus TaxID=1548597 RepID=A0A4Q0VNC2_9BACI|nr:hypothetical protein [Anaerobacillus alkaliphilus]RXI96476.1 hypothetical protein DS745_22460 [Anaerobacillus alkaliphilus]
MSEEVVYYLHQLKNLYSALDTKEFDKDIAKIDQIISTFEVPSKKIEPKSKKRNFTEMYQLLLAKNFHLLTGTKLNYQVFPNGDDIVHFIEKNSKADVIKETTALDLKLLYSLLTEDPNEIKGTKSHIYEAIKRNVRAGRRGEAFIKSY